MKTNWSGAVAFNHQEQLSPKTAAEIQSYIKQHPEKSIRVRGSGHSFTELCTTTEVLLDLDHMQGIVNFDKETHRLTALAGTKLFRLGSLAFEHGVALPNQGDIDAQSVAGAIGTGTHGTGMGLKNVSNQLYGFEAVNASGDLMAYNADEHPDKLKAFAVSLGCLGVMTQVTLNMVPTYALKLEVWREDMGTLMRDLKTHLSGNRHFELMYMPLGGWAQAKRMNLSIDVPQKKGWWTRFNEGFLENAAFEKFNQLAMATKQFTAINKGLKYFVGTRQHTDWAHRAFPAERRVKFHEMEFSFPVDQIEAVLDEVRHCVRRSEFHTLFPIEIRFSRGDDLWLSTAHGQDSAYLAIHMYHRQKHLPLFNALQAIFVKHKARPHWGKWHSLDACYFEQVYPKWHDFVRLREELDPKGRWLNPYLSALFYPKT